METLLELSAVIVLLFSIILGIRERNVSKSIIELKKASDDLVKDKNTITNDLFKIKVSNDGEYFKQYYELNITAYSLYYQAEFIRTATNNLINTLDKIYNKEEINNLNQNLKNLDIFSENVRKAYLKNEINTPLIKFNTYNEGPNIGEFFSKN